jgi:glyoxylase-like metal-dependent hydrolase (beta-lactamase superfamily II)
MRLAAGAALAGVLAAGGAGLLAQGAGGVIETLHVQGNVYLLAGPEGNTVVQIGDEGVLVVDTQGGEVSGPLLDAIAALSDQPIRHVLNTHAHADHIGGNAVVAAAGRTRAGGNVVGDIGADATSRATILAHENVLNRLSAPSGRAPAVPFEMWPMETFFVPAWDFRFNGEAIRLLHQPRAHTDGDILVFFRSADVIATGDVFGTTGYPVIDVAAGGHVNGVIHALNVVIDIAVPNKGEEGGTVVVPGQGRITDEWEVVEYRDMVTIVRDRIATLIERGRTLDEVLAAAPTLEYDPRYGATSGAWTIAMFVETVYRNLTAGP